MKDSNSNKIEIAPKQIFEQMRENIYKNFAITNFPSTNKNYIYFRKTLFTILHKITNTMGFKSQTFFLSAHYLDIIFSSKENINMNINLVSLAALCLSAKFCENDPNVPHLQYFIKVYNMIMGYKNIISMKDLKNAEVLLLKLLNYKLNYHTVYDFNSFLFGHGILKFEQLREINKNQVHYRNGRNEFIINQASSMIIKNILEKIYKKSRLYLDIILNKTKLCFKYNSLLLSIYIMKKSVVETLAYEEKIYLWNKIEQEDFYKRNSSCFKEIMFDYYNIEYENTEEYKKLINDEEIQSIFEKKLKISNEISIPSSVPKNEEKKDNETENNIKKINNNENKENKDVFTSSVSNGFYKRLQLNINMDELYKRQSELNERNAITFRKGKSSRRSINYSTVDNIDNIDISKNNINESHSVQKRQLIKNNNVINAKRSAYNIYSSNKEINTLNSSNNLPRKFSNFFNNNRIIPRIEAYNNFNNYRKTINYLKSSENLYFGSKTTTNKSEIKSEKNSPIKFDEASNNNNNPNYSRIQKYTKLNVLNMRKDQKDYSFSITENYNSEINKKSCDKKPYLKKLIHQNTSENNYSLLNFNNTNKNINTEKIRFDINNEDSSKRDNKITKYYTRINLKKPNNETLDTSIAGNENTFRNNNFNNQLIISSSRFRRVNTINNNLNNNNDISEEIKNDNIRNKVEPYNKDILNHNKGLTSLNFYRNSRNKISFKNTKIAETMDNRNDESIRSLIEPKRITNLLGKQNSELNNTLKEINKAFAMNKKEEQISEFKDKEKETNSNLSNSIISNNNNIKVNFTKSIRQKYLNINKSNKNCINVNKNNTLMNSNNNNNDLNNNKNEILSYNTKQSNTIVNTNNISVKKRYSSKNQNNYIKNNNLINNNLITNNNINNKTCDNIKDNDKNDDKNDNNNLSNIVQKEELNNNNNNKDNNSKISFKNNVNETKRYLKIQKHYNKEEQNKKTKDNDDNIKINNNTNTNFYTKNNFFKTFKTEKNIEVQRNKEEIIKNQQDKTIENNIRLRSILYKNKLNKNNITNNRSQKNISAIDIYNNNIENRNITNEYVRYKNIYRKNNVNGLILNSSLLNAKNEDTSLNKSNINNNDNNNNNYIKKVSNNLNSKKNLLNTLHYYRKAIDKVNTPGNLKTIIFSKK